MLHIIEGANFVGKTTTIDVLKKRKPAWAFAYHPRFNDSKFFSFAYHEKGDPPSLPRDSQVHRDIVYQISHLTCLKYLESFNGKNIFLDRCFLSEMVYNEYHNKQIYNEFLNILKSKFDYKIYYLTCDSEEQLKKRINKRVKDDKDKNFGVRVYNITKESINDIVESRYQMQRALDLRFRTLLTESNLNHVVIDTSEIRQSKVAQVILKDIKCNQTKNLTGSQST